MMNYDEKTGSTRRWKGGGFLFALILGIVAIIFVGYNLYYITL